MNQAIFIQWTEQENEFVGWNYVGGGCQDPIFKTKTVKRNACWSADVTDENIAKAKAYCKKERPDAKVIIKDDTRK